MATQDAITNALAALSGSTAALAAALAAAFVLWLGAEYALNAFDVHVPVRQLMLGRSLNALAMYARYLHTVVAGPVAGSAFSRTGKAFAKSRIQA